MLWYMYQYTFHLFSLQHVHNTWVFHLNNHNVCVINTSQVTCTCTIFLQSDANINNGWIRYVWTIQWWLLDSVSSKRSFSVLLSAMETSCTTQTPPSASSVTIVIHNLNTCVRATYSSHSYYLRTGFISFRAPDCATTIRGQWLFEGGVYLKKYGMTVWMQPCYRAYTIASHNYAPPRA